ncbi:hypothetical protein PHYSODRAFT_301495 [Phytophthora sojae]|uniref:Uncharacterized protein n=1 Tax=Phytophthora sojae (strain P6497) TaxID=1094619 RepID=G4ZJZ5_PHYSP|nr:hypothetical protein PHYSODRAFT_301495 [Phytophthora sojae]EGZ14477.1 hypothetical protein PHYSODRAFT_301495 [Phytophthora sojae]|eukprot:XP_009528226.1 hypothetical protein PHYSODRAFT_301495 [Phytophthora sojae]
MWAPLALFDTYGVLSTAARCKGASAASIARQAVQFNANAHAVQCSAGVLNNNLSTPSPNKIPHNSRQSMQMSVKPEPSCFQYPFLRVLAAFGWTAHNESFGVLLTYMFRRCDRMGRLFSGTSTGAYGRRWPGQYTEDTVLVASRKLRLATPGGPRRR